MRVFPWKCALRLKVRLCPHVQEFLRKPAVSRVITKISGAETDPAALAPYMLARYDMDDNKVLDKVRSPCGSVGHGGALSQSHCCCNGHSARLSSL